MKVLYLPLDERPCNLRYPKDIASINEEISLITPDINILGNKKKAADINLLHNFIYDNIMDCDYFICSVDMLCFGGLIPSRLHMDDIDIITSRLEILKEVKKRNPNIIIYPFSSIMRTPSYSSSDEEPDYYQDYGYEIFKTKYLSNKQERGFITDEEIKELNELKQIPSEIVYDYETRRKTNNLNLINILKLQKDKLFEELVIFQDDSAPFGYTAIDQLSIKETIIKYNLNSKVHIYPGADEVGCSLLIKAYNHYKNLNPKIYVEFSSTNAKSLIPLYEDRPMYETLKHHVGVVDGIMIDSSMDADYILMVNAPGNKMQESWDQFDNKDLQYDTYRNLKYFVSKIKYYINLGYKVMISDVAYANGGDYELIKLLDEEKLLDQVYAYAGWNTHANTTGTVLASGLINDKINNNTLNNIKNHIMEDCLYQAIIRMDVNKNQLPLIDLNYFDLKDKQNLVIDIELEKLKPYLLNLNILKDITTEDINLTHPWNRMFEVDLYLK